jgi:hypothetical protein
MSIATEVTIQVVADQKQHVGAIGTAAVLSPTGPSQQQANQNNERGTHDVGPPVKHESMGNQRNYTRKNWQNIGAAGNAASSKRFPISVAKPSGKRCADGSLPVPELRAGGTARSIRASTAEASKC